MCVFCVLWRLYRVACAVSPDAGMRNGFVRFAKRFVSSPSVVSAARRFFAFCSLTLCFKACGFVKIHSLLTGAPALFRAARQKIKHPLPLRKRVFFVLIRCFCHFAVYRSFYRSYFVMHFYAAVSVHLYFSSFIFINILLFYPAPFLPYCCRLTVYRTGKAEKLQARQEYRKARP